MLDVCYACCRESSTCLTLQDDEEYGAGDAAEDDEGEADDGDVCYACCNVSADSCCIGSSTRLMLQDDEEYGAGDAAEDEEDEDDEEEEDEDGDGGRPAKARPVAMLSVAYT